jgi:hypothetical protein
MTSVRIYYAVKFIGMMNAKVLPTLHTWSYIKTHGRLPAPVLAQVPPSSPEMLSALLAVTILLLSYAKAQVAEWGQCT